ncbi:MAG: thioredoxin family protein [Magnetovibrionaceae bacterium]
MLKRMAIALVLLFSAAALPVHAADKPLDYSPGLIKELLAEGKTLFVDYAASWCGTCRSQENTIAELRAENLAYDAAMTFIRVDWDTYEKAEVRTSRDIPRRSTLIVLRGDAELGRIVADTSKDNIRKLMDLGL